MISVLCVLWGDRYSHDYVRKLKAGFERHLSLPHRFRCITSQTVEGVECVPEQCPHPAWWQKIGAFRPGFVTGPAILCDLDMLFVRSLDWVSYYLDADLAAIENWGSRARQGPLYEDELSSAFMVWSGNGATDAIYERFSARDIRRLSPHGDQTFITEVMRDKVRLIPQERIASFKRHCADGPPEAASVVAFHGLPRPHEVDAHWVKAAWQ